MAPVLFALGECIAHDVALDASSMLRDWHPRGLGSTLPPRDPASSSSPLLRIRGARRQLHLKTREQVFKDGEFNGLAR